MDVLARRTVADVTASVSDLGISRALQLAAIAGEIAPQVVDYISDVHLGSGVVVKAGSITGLASPSWQFSEGKSRPAGANMFVVLDSLNSQCSDSLASQLVFSASKEF